MNSISALKRALAASLLLVATIATAADKPQRPIPAVEHIVLISVDGLRPDVALRANMPTLRTLLREGSFTFWAKTTAVSLTLPSHTSMVTGVIPDKHGLTWNSDIPLSVPVYPRRPTVMELATQAGYSTAMVAGKSKFSALNRPGTITYVSVPKGKDSTSSTEEVATNAAHIILSHKPNLLFVHFPDVDIAGHTKGWGSDEQVAAIEHTDTQLARVFAALDKAGIRQSTVVILSADHGGAGLIHGAEDVRSRHIPWIATGPGIKHNFDLTQLAEVEVRTEDSAATIHYLLGLTPPKPIDGKPVMAVFSAIPAQ